MKNYHLRDCDKGIEDPGILDAIILGQKYLTMAMCIDSEPYLATVNYYYDKEQRFFYFHCSLVGKKIDFLNSNPVVWGQVICDLGYVQGECAHRYRTVQFKGRVEFLSNNDEKLFALECMMDQLEDSVTKERKEKLRERDLDKVAIGKITIDWIGGKQGQ
jgi:nitroimidazol reductase NimA-like FMN-containing flavoprotein (pyridoxamine 5'-phosphate oxidase superfamily)